MATEMDEKRAEIKAHLESFEHWSRRLINDEMTIRYGKDYFNIVLPDGNSLIKQEIIKRIEERMREKPQRFPRKIDATVMEDISYFFCKDEFYNACFRPVFKDAFAGKEDIRKRLEKMVVVRNKLSHENPISFREAEQAMCYGNDFIDAYKEYYRMIGKEEEYNVPFFIKAEDNYGRRKEIENGRLDDLSSGNGILKLRPGDTYKIWIEVDSNFPEDFYEIIWTMHDKQVGTGKAFEYTININDVSDYLILGCVLITKRVWHKYSHTFDDSYSTTFAQVLPPIEDY